MSARPLLAAALIAASLCAPSAHATEVCFENNTLTFDPPLTLANQIGTVTVRYEKTCADEPGLTPGHYSGTNTFGYFGSCALAIFTEPTLSFMAGGVVHLMVGETRAKVVHLQPSSLCPGPVASAHGSGVMAG